MRWDNRRTK